MKTNTQIICTLGPATDAFETLLAMIEAGMDYARLNFSHGDRDAHRETAQKVREAAGRAGRSVKIIQDLQGPKLRIGRLPNPLHLEAGAEVVLSPDPGGSLDIPIEIPEMVRWLRVGDRLFLDDGAVELEVRDKRDGRLVCTVRTGGRVDSRSGIALPEQRSELPALTEKDLADLDSGCEIGVEAVAQSMVRSREDVDQLRKHLADAVPIVAKIEDAAALRDLHRIADGVWGMMVARGDLGVSIPRAQVPLWQKEILALCRERGLFGIVATEMLLSMVTNERPTRAEVSDVATAVLDGAKAVMLSEETAIGAHPVEAVREMREIIETVESSRWYRW